MEHLRILAAANAEIDCSPDAHDGGGCTPSGSRAAKRAVAKKDDDRNPLLSCSANVRSIADWCVGFLRKLPYIPKDPIVQLKANWGKDEESQELESRGLSVGSQFKNKRAFTIANLIRYGALDPGNPSGELDAEVHGASKRRSTTPTRQHGIIAHNNFSPTNPSPCRHFRVGDWYGIYSLASSPCRSPEYHARTIMVSRGRVTSKRLWCCSFRQDRASDAPLHTHRRSFTPSIVSLYRSTFVVCWCFFFYSSRGTIVQYCNG